MSDKLFMMGLDPETDKDAIAFMDMMNQLIEDGKIRMEVDDEGTPRFYPVD